MKLAEAVRLVNERKSRSPAKRYVLACGFTPLHLQTFLTAHLLGRLEGAVELEIGLYGDLAGNLERIDANAVDGIAVVVEWADVDPRLAYRNPQGWRAAGSQDSLDTACLRLARLRAAIESLARRTVVSVALPTLPLPPCSRWADAGIAVLKEEVSQFGKVLAAVPGIRVLCSDQLDWLVPIRSRLDMSSEIRSGFPYHLEHASVLAVQLAALLCPAVPKKGLITDLDNTLWSGLLGEVGVDGVTWDLDHHSLGHALYQGVLASLAEVGVLIGVASKNDPELVQKALGRQDLILPADAVFPVKSNWGPKSESVRQILKAWNVGEESVVFVDDSPLEIAEVQASFSQIQGLRFPTGDDREVLELLRKLCELFGKTSVSYEDRIRVTSLRAGDRFAAESDQLTPDAFLRNIQAEIVLQFDKPDLRALELINKTNQFNLNGRRIDEKMWKERIEDGRHFLVSVSYEDKFGPLGKIGVVSGQLDAAAPLIDIWVMSCRAFSRRIEYQVLQSLFDWFEPETLRFDLAITQRNGPLRDFFKAILGHDPEGPLELTQKGFLHQCPSLYSKVNIA